MDNEPEMIKQQMEDTRASLAEKLETLEQQVVGTVQDTTTAVTETVENVKEGVQDTVDAVKDAMQDAVASVKETFDIRLQTERRPWLMFGGSIALGYAAGYLWTRSSYGHSLPHLHVPHWGSRPAPRDNGWSAGTSQHAYNYRPSEPTPAPPPSESTEPGLLTQAGNMFGPELQQLKGLAIGAALGLIRDMVARSLPPQMGSQINEVADNITTKLGGQPMQGPILERFEDPTRRSSANDPGYAAGAPSGRAF